MQISDGIITQGFIIYWLCGHLFLSLPPSHVFLPFLTSFVAIIYKTQKMRWGKMHFLRLFNCVYAELCHLFPNIAISLLRPGGATASERAKKERGWMTVIANLECVRVRDSVWVCVSARERERKLHICFTFICSRLFPAHLKCWYYIIKSI